MASTESEEATAETRIDLAIEAGAKALHESAREGRQLGAIVGGVAARSAGLRPTDR